MASDSTGGFTHSYVVGDQSYVSRETNAARHPAVETEHETKSGRHYDRFQCVDKRLYIFSSTWPQGQPKPQQFERVVNSFRLTME
jgi:hypothetical protein